MVWPSTSRLPAKRRCQTPWLRMTTWCRPTCVSCAVKVRPRAGLRPRTSKKSSVTREPLRRSGSPAAGEVEPLIAERGDAGEGVVLIAVAEVISGGEGELRKSGLQIALAHDHELLGFVEPQRLEQHGVDHREDGGIGSDSQGQSQHGNAGEPRVATQGAEGVAEVAEYGRKHGYGLDEGERRALARVGRVQIVDPRARRVHHGFSTMMFPNFVLVFGFLDRLSPPENSHHG